VSRNEGASAESEDALPAIDFATFVLSLSHSVLMHLGDAPDPSGGVTKRDVAMAKQTIDLLSVIQEKTAGNLSGEEERLVNQVMIDLRARYEEVLREA
jgi:hypothetical protein